MPGENAQVGDELFVRIPNTRIFSWHRVVGISESGLYLTRKYPYHPVFIKFSDIHILEKKPKEVSK